MQLNHEIWLQYRQRKIVIHSRLLLRPENLENQVFTAGQLLMALSRYCQSIRLLFYKLSRICCPTQCLFFLPSLRAWIRFVDILYITCDNFWVCCFAFTCSFSYFWHERPSFNKFLFICTVCLSFCTWLQVFTRFQDAFNCHNQFHLTWLWNIASFICERAVTTWAWSTTCIFLG